MPSMVAPVVTCTPTTVTVLVTSPMSVPVGTPVSLIATLSSATPATGTVTFVYYEPSDPGCTGTPAPSMVPVTAAPATMAPPFTPTKAGVYHVVAKYSGDATHTAATSPCSSASGFTTSSFTATALSPTISVTVPPSVPAGGTITAKATLVGAFQPTGTVTFAAYGSDDLKCTGKPVGTVVADVPPGSLSTSSPAIPVKGSGVFRFVATYSGDAANKPATSACNDPAATVTVTGPAGPAVTPPGPVAKCDPAAMAHALLSALVASLTGTQGASFQTTCSAGLRIVMRAKEIRKGNRGFPRRDGFTTMANVLTHSSPSGQLAFSFNTQGVALRDYARTVGASLVVFGIVHVRPDHTETSSESVQIFTLT